MYSTVNSRNQSKRCIAWRLKYSICLLSLWRAVCRWFKHGNSILTPVVKIINSIRSRGLNHRQFKTFRPEINCEQTDDVFYSKIRWLSCGKALKRFWDQIEIFLQHKTLDLSVFENVSKYLNQLNTSLQGRNQPITRMKDLINGFEGKLENLGNSLKKKNLFHFPTLNSVTSLSYSLIQNSNRTSRF